MVRSPVLALIFLSLSLPANAALLERAGGLAYYDDVLGITWVADADLASTYSFDVSGVSYYWRPQATAMTWPVAQEWIAALNASGYLGVSDWRLPVLDPSDPSGASNEMLQLYSTIQPVLINDAPPTDLCPGPRPYCLTHTEPFANVQPYLYWLGTESGPNLRSAWYFSFNDGYSSTTDKLLDRVPVWPVRDGDIGVVPAPASIWLLGTALAGLVGRDWLRRKAAANT